MTQPTQAVLPHGFSENVLTLLNAELDPTNLGYLEREFKNKKHYVPYLPAEKAMRLLNKIFGPANWGTKIREHTLIEKTVDQVTEKWDNEQKRYAPVKTPYNVYTVVYKCHMDFVCVDPYNGFRSESRDNIGTGIAEKMSNLSLAHDTAAKAAVTDALSRCVYGLGDPFGLCLRDKGFVRELTQNGSHEAASRQPARPVQSSSSGSTTTAVATKNEPPATEMHIKQILNKAQKAKMDTERMYAEIAKVLNRKITDLGDLTQTEAKAIINTDW